MASRRRFYDRNHVPVYGGSAWFVDEHTLEVRTRTGTPERISADYHGGVLTVRIPVADKAKPRRIAIGHTDDRKAIDA